MVKNHQKVLNDRQIEILQTLAIKGKQNKSQLSSEFGVKYPAVVGSMKILVDRNLAKPATYKEKGVGKPKLFYELTDAGLEKLSKDNRTSLEKFWEIAFLIYGKITRNFTRVSADLFFSSYEKNVIGYSPEYTTPSWSFVIDAYDLLYKRPIKHSIFTMILYTLAVNGKLSENQIISKILKSKDSYISISSSQNEIIEQLRGMISYKTIITNLGKETKYRISSLGMLILFHHLIDRMQENTSGRYKDLELILQKIALRSQSVMPKIFPYWEDLLKIESGVNLLLRFNTIGNDHIPASNSLQQGGIAELILVEKMLVRSNLAKIGSEYMAGLHTLSKLFKEKRYPEGRSSDATLRLAYLGILNHYTKEESHILEKVTKKKNYSLEQIADKSLANIIAFEFYLHLIELVKSHLPQGFNTSSVTDRENFDQWIKDSLNKWNDFTNNNTDLRKWYEGWIRQIIEFERKNIKILDEKLKLSHSLRI